MSQPPPPGPPEDPYQQPYPQQPPAGYPQQPGYPPQQGHPQYPGGYGTEPPTGDPLVPADLSGWFAGVIGVFRRSFGSILPIQIGVAVINAIFGIVVGNRVTEITNGFAAAPETVGPAQLSTVFTLGFVGLAIGLVVSAFAQGASIFLAIRDASGEPAGVGTALGFAAGRAPALIGWSILAFILFMLGCILLLLPGLYLGIVFAASLFGVVVVERGGIGRCFQLVNARFWATTGRMLLAFLFLLVYSFIVNLIVGVFGAGSVPGAIVQAILAIPSAIVFVGIIVVTYAELRFRERPDVSTATLAAELRR